MLGYADMDIIEKPTTLADRIANLKQWMRRGSDLPLACKLAGISETVVREWLNVTDDDVNVKDLHNFELDEAALADLKLAETIYKQATEEVVEVHTITSETMNECDVLMERTITRKVITRPPDASLALKLLQQRRPQDYHQARVEANLALEEAAPTDIQFVEHKRDTDEG